ncbi:MAG: hypothetical protein AAF564_23395 [Bacteroidota bacterium]
MKMRILFFLAILCLTTSSFGQDDPKIQQSDLLPDVLGAYHLTKVDYKITIQSEEGVVTTLDFPKDMILYIEASMGQVIWEGEPRVFSGDITLRALRNDELKLRDNFSEKMEASPFQLNLSNVVLTIERECPGNFAVPYANCTLAG